MDQYVSRTRTHLLQMTRGDGPRGKLEDGSQVFVVPVNILKYISHQNKQHKKNIYSMHRFQAKIYVSSMNFMSQPQRMYPTYWLSVIIVVDNLPQSLSPVCPTWHPFLFCPLIISSWNTGTPSILLFSLQKDPLAISCGYISKETGVLCEKVFVENLW